MDADSRIIPLVEDDQGEGIKDFFNDHNENLNQMYKKFAGFEADKLEMTLEKGKSDSDMLQLILDKVEALDRKIDRIFGGSVLIEGRWIKLAP